jgi:F0F1-type ATP synthase membrane subunit c/vacuolar-type H+-ATPase subunit K
MTIGQSIIISGKYIGTGLATIGVTGAGIGMGILFGNYLQALARNPLMKNDLFAAVLLGFALTEAIALFALMIAFLILFK